MSEKEIINKIKEIIEYSKLATDIGFADQTDKIEALQGILDLYTKQKEINSELEIINKTNPEKIKIIADSFNEKVLDKFNKEVILKDTIREKIKEVQNIKKEVEKLTDNKMKWNETLRLDSKIIILKELLEE